MSHFSEEIADEHQYSAYIEHQAYENCNMQYNKMLANQVVFEENAEYQEITSQDEDVEQASLEEDIDAYMDSKRMMK